MTMTTTAPAAEVDEYTPHASSKTALKEAQIQLVEAQTALKAVDLRSLKGEVRTEVKAARDAIETALKVSRRK